MSDDLKRAERTEPMPPAPGPEADPEPKDPETLGPRYNVYLNYPSARKKLRAAIIAGKDHLQLAAEWRVRVEVMEDWWRKLCIEVYEERFGKTAKFFVDEETKFFLGQTELMLEADEAHLRGLSRGVEVRADSAARLTKLASTLRKQRIQIRQEVGALPSKLFKPTPEKEDELPQDPEELEAEIRKLEKMERDSKKIKRLKERAA